MKPAAIICSLIGAFALGMVLIGEGIYGVTLFCLIPAYLALQAVRQIERRSAWQAAGLGAATASLGATMLLVIGVEGFLCVLMTIPLVAPIGALVGFLNYRSGKVANTMSGAAALVLVPFSLTWDMTRSAPVYEVQSSIEIAAPPEAVWKNVVSFSDLPEPEDLVFHTGLAYPKRARIEGYGPGAIRYCEFSTGVFVEPIEVWEEPRLLRFKVTSSPSPMREWSPYGQITPKHLHGYIVSKRGQFRLIPLANNHTLLEGTTWYQHGLLPAPYWRLWSDAIIHRIHLRVLNHIRVLSENPATLPAH